MLKSIVQYLITHYSNDKYNTIKCGGELESIARYIKVYGCIKNQIIVHTGIFTY